MYRAVKRSSKNGNGAVKSVQNAYPWIKRDVPPRVVPFFTEGTLIYRN